MDRASRRTKREVSLMYERIRKLREKKKKNHSSKVKRRQTIKLVGMSFLKVVESGHTRQAVKQQK